MARITGIDLQDKWRIDYGLTRIKGVGWTTAMLVLRSLKIDGSKKVGDLTNDEISQIAGEIGKSPTEGELSRKVRADIARLKAIGSYRGLRHNRGLPSRGQRTRSNARTKRGKRKTVGAFKKDMLAKTPKTEKEK